MDSTELLTQHKITLDGDCSREIKRHLLLGRKANDQPWQHMTKQRHYFANKVHLAKSVVFPVVIYSCESWTTKKNECRRNQLWIFIGRTDAEAEAPILWPPEVKSQLVGKDSDAGKDWRQEEKGTTEDDVVGWHHLRNRHEFEKTPGDGKGQGSLECCSSWGCKELDMT